MKLSSIILVGLATGLHAQKEMDRLMDLKIKHWDKMRADGAFDKFDNARKQAIGYTACVGGKAGEYACDRVDLLSFLSHQEMGSTTKEGNDVWGNSSSMIQTWISR